MSYWKEDFYQLYKSQRDLIASIDDVSKLCEPHKSLIEGFALACDAYDKKDPTLKQRWLKAGDE